jgi:hypothetical protein
VDDWTPSSQPIWIWTQTLHPLQEITQTYHKSKYKMQNTKLLDDTGKSLDDFGWIFR